MKVGKYEIPDTRLYPTLIEATKKIYEKFRSEEAPNQLVVAQHLDHKSVSGTFLTKLASLRAYGLIEKRGIRVTELGKRLTYGTTEEEKNEALKATILNIPLWKGFYDKWGVNLPTEDFWVDLSTITGLEAPDAQNVAKIVAKAYLDDIKYLKPEKEPEKTDEGIKPDAKVDASKAIPEGVLGRVTVKDAGYIDVKDKTTYEIAKAYLKLFAEKLGIIEKQPKEEV